MSREDSGETVFAAHICIHELVQIYFSTKNLKVKVFFTDSSKAVLLLCTIFCYLCLVFVVFSCLFVVDLWPPAGKRAEV